VWLTIDSNAHRGGTAIKLRIVFMGTPGFAVPVLDALVDAGYDVVGVYTQPDRETGRGKRLTPPPTKQAALEKGIPVFQPKSLRRDEGARRALISLGPDLIVVAAYGLLLPPEVFDTPRLKTLNVHPSLLPKHRGPSPVASAILSGDEVTGVTIMQIAEGMDSGPILAQRQTPIAPDETADALTERLFQMGAQLLVEVIPRWESGGIQPQPQDESQATVTKLLSREDGEIDWQRPADYIARQVRAYHPWPGTFTRWQSKTLKIIEASAAEGSAPPGRVVSLPGGEIGVGTSRGVLVLKQVQLEGKRAVSAREFVQGYRDFTASQLGG
ncbi:MAG: methionyl-tRNA formyltransferase, partial [Chloroflexi bacterium]|nr:methionyl-tRNA formyltransferase [Chloroflexota bacterium]